MSKRLRLFLSSNLNFNISDGDIVMTLIRA